MVSGIPTNVVVKAKYNIDFREFTEEDAVYIRISDVEVDFGYITNAQRISFIAFLIKHKFIKKYELCKNYLVLHSFRFSQVKAKRTSTSTTCFRACQRDDAIDYQFKVTHFLEPE